MAEQPPLTDAERDNLVAYLDGELDGQAARAVEAQINLDPRVRTEAESLRNAWDMLDYLPRPEPSATFTDQTLERLSIVRAAPQARRRWRLAAAWAAAVLIAALAGFGVTESILSQYPTDEDLVRDLRVIENRRLYEPVDDLDFLHKLDNPDLFGDDNADS